MSTSGATDPDGSFANEGNRGENTHVLALSDKSFADSTIATCPFPHYQDLRKQCPVLLDPKIGYYWITRRSDVGMAAQDWQRFRSKCDLQNRKVFQPRAQKLWDEAGFTPLDTLVSSDPPEHEDYRWLGMTLFTPKRVNEITPAIHDAVHDLIDAFAEEGQCEFVRQFASLLPATIVCDEYGFPREDRNRFRQWTDAVTLLQTPGISEDEEVELTKRLIALYGYLDHYLKKAASGPSGRVIHSIASLNRKDGTPFSWLERASMALVVFVGGNETTANALASAAFILATRQDVQQALRDDPALIENFVEEVLRYQPSVQALVRVANEDIELEGTRIPSGSYVILCTGSANRDEQFWQCPEDFRLDRSNARQHYTFGYGRHACIGMHLARREMCIAVKLLLERLKDIRLQDPSSPPTYLPLPFFRALAAVPLAFRGSDRGG